MRVSEKCRKKWADSIKADYPNGARVILEASDNDYTPPAGTRGTVRGVSDYGVVFVMWDNGMESGIVFEFGDIIRRLDE